MSDKEQEVTEVTEQQQDNASSDMVKQFEIFATIDKSAQQKTNRGRPRGYRKIKKKG